MHKDFPWVLDDASLRFTDFSCFELCLYITLPRNQTLFQFYCFGFTKNFWWIHIIYSPLSLKVAPLAPERWHGWFSEIVSIPSLKGMGTVEQYKQLLECIALRKDVRELAFYLNTVKPLTSSHPKCWSKVASQKGWPVIRGSQECRPKNSLIKAGIFTLMGIWLYVKLS